MKQYERNEIFRGLRRRLPTEAANRADQVSVYAVAVGEKLGLTNRELLTLRYAACLQEFDDDDVAREHRFLAPARRVVREVRRSSPRLIESQILVAVSVFVDAAGSDAAAELLGGALLGAAPLGAAPLGADNRLEERIAASLLQVRGLIQPIVVA